MSHFFHQAKANLSRLIAQARAGAEVMIARGAEPVARIVPWAVRGRCQPGDVKGRLQVGKEFFEPLPEDALAAWE